jgi:hypothetical protein
MSDFIANPFTAQGFWIWVAALLTFGAFSFLFKDNPLYKLTEHIFVGTAAGYYAALEYNTVIKPNLFMPLQRGLVAHPTPGSALSGIAQPNTLEFAFYVLALILCIMMILRLAPGIGWISRWPLSAMVGIYAGLGAIGALQGDFFPQLEASIVPLRLEGSGPGAVLHLVSNILILVGVVTTLIFFYYSIEHRGTIGGLAKIGMYFLMTSFGAAYGFTVMGRISLLVGRLQFLLSEWLHVVKL